MELKILEKIKKEKRLDPFMNCGFLKLNNGFVHCCYPVSLDNLLVSFLVFLNVDYGSWVWITVQENMPSNKH